jgi:hypothetical protein
MPARFADATKAREAALTFDLRQLPANYYANPYPTYHALREYSLVHRLPDGGYFLSRYCRLCGALQGHLGLLFRQEARVRAKIRAKPAPRAPYDKPRLQ